MSMEMVQIKQVLNDNGNKELNYAREKSLQYIVSERDGSRSQESSEKLKQEAIEHHTKYMVWREALRIVSPLLYEGVTKKESSQ